MNSPADERLFGTDTQAETARPSLALEAIVLVLQHWKLLAFVPLLAGCVALGIAFLVKPVFTARTTLLPPQSQQSVGSAALASLGALAGLAGAGGVRTPADQYVALMQSETVRNRLIDEFKLMDVYQAPLKTDARRIMDLNVRITVGKKDGLITVEVDDESPERAAALANGHVDQLRRVSADLALTEAQQRRVFFEGQVKATRERLDKAQRDLQGTGLSAGVLRSEPKAAADSYARLRAEVTAVEVRIQGLRRTLADTAPEVQNQLGVLQALKEQLARAEASLPANGAPDYLGKYREFKYQESLYELFSKQYELARLDEAKEGALIQVIDPAAPPERKSRPKRAFIAVSTTLATLIVLLLGLMLRQAWRRMRADPVNAGTLAQLDRTLGRG